MPDTSVDYVSGRPYPSDMEARLAVLEQIAKSVAATFDRMDRRFEQVERRFEQIDRRFGRVDERFDRMDRRINLLDQRMAADFRWLLGIMLGGFTTILGLMAHGFHWF